MEEKKKVRVVFEFDRKDYDNVVFLLGVNRTDDEVERAWETMTTGEVALKSDSFATLGVTPQEMLAMFVAGAVIATEDKAKNKAL